MGRQEMTPDVISWRRNQAAVTVAAFIGFTGFTLVMPFLPLYFGELGMTDPSDVAIWSGVSLGITPAITAAMTPVWARLADRVGRKLMVMRSLVSFVVIMSLMAYVTAPWQVFALRAIQGLFAGYGAIAMTMAAESAPPEHLAAAIGWVQTAQRLGPALGPAIGGVLAAALGLRRAFLVSASFYAVAFLLVLFVYHERKRQAHPPVATAPAPASFGSLWLVRHFTLFVATVFGLQLIDRSFGPVLPLYLVEIGLTENQVPFWSGMLFATTAVAAAAGNQATSRLLRRRTAAALVPEMAVLAACAALIFAWVTPLGVLMPAAVVFGTGMGVATTAIYAAATDAVPPTSRGLAFAYLTRAYLVGLAVSPVVAGLVGALSMRAVFLCDAIGLGLVAWIVRIRMARGAPASP